MVGGVNGAMKVTADVEDGEVVFVVDVEVDDESWVSVGE